MRVVVVGAGMAGLVAARSLHDVGIDVVAVDKGRSPGGRMATRRIGAAVLDHGAQFFTVRTPEFRHRVDGWLERELVRVWNHGFAQPDGHPRYVAPAGMTSLAKDLAGGLHVECSTMVFALRPGADDAVWNVTIDDGTIRPADRVIITTPLPQTFSLLADSMVELDPLLMRTDYERTICLLTVIDGEASLPGTGGVQTPGDIFGFIGDNRSKGLSTVPAVTFHATPAWSLEHWSDSEPSLARLLTTAAEPWLDGARIIDHQVKKWRFATPMSVWPDPCWMSPEGSVVLAGDAFAGPRVEGAHNSGLAAAAAILGAASADVDRP